MGEHSVISAKFRWGRLLSEADAAEYLGIGTTSLRGLALKSRNIGRRVLYDIRDLDSWVDRMEDAPVVPEQLAGAQAAEEAAFFQRRQARGRG